MPRGKNLLIAIAFAAIYLIWGTTYLAIGVTVETVPPVFMVVLRGAIAGGVLYWVSRVRGGAPVEGREMLAIAPTALLLFGGGYVLVGWAEQSVASGPAALLNATTPAWVVLIEWLARRRSRPTLKVVAGLLGGVVGVVLLVSGGGGDARPLAVLPALALVAASAAWAGGTVLAGKRSHGDAMRGAAVQLLTGALLLLPVSIGLGEIGMLARTPATSSSLVALGYLVVFGSLIGYTAYSWLLHQVPASKVASHSYVNPLVAVIVGALLAREPVTVYTLVAAALIIVSVVVIITEKRGNERDSKGPGALARSRVLSSLRPKRSTRTLELARQSHEIAPVRRGSGDHHQPERSSGAVRTA